MFKFLAILILTFSLYGCSSEGKPADWSPSFKALEETEKIIEINNQKVQTEEEVLSDSVSTATPKVKGVKIDQAKYFKVVKVVDGDTLDLEINGKIERVRLIGVNTPESVDPRREVECYGKEASVKAQELLLGKEVSLEADPSQGDMDKYGRLLRYVKTKEGLFYNLEIIKLGFAKEYTYKSKYKFQDDFKNAQEQAKRNGDGIWSMCLSQKQEEINQGSDCKIKGNINVKKEKIYHLPDCPDYAKSKIDVDSGEKWFCSESEAVTAGWRKAGNCR